MNSSGKKFMKQLLETRFKKILSNNEAGNNDLDFREVVEMIMETENLDVN